LHAEDETLPLQIKKFSYATEFCDRALVIGSPIRTHETRGCANQEAGNKRLHNTRSTENNSFSFFANSMTFHDLK
jgi:hypothetical protein